MTIYDRQNCLYPHLSTSWAYKKKCRCVGCKQAKSDKAAKFYLKNKEYIVTKLKDHREKHQEHYQKCNAEYYKKNTEKIKQKVRVYGRNNKKKKNQYHQERTKTDPIYALKRILRSRLYSALRSIGSPKTKHTLELLGCSIEDLKSHLESLFKDNMTWGNRGMHGWHIDHIIPLASAGSDIDRIYELCHFTNLQPLWAHENLTKGDKLI